MAAMEIMMGGYALVDLEDDIFIQRNIMTSSVDLNEESKRIAAEFERVISIPYETWEMFGL